MKRFAFTLTAVLAATAAFAQTDSLNTPRPQNDWMRMHKSDFEVSIGLNTFADRNTSGITGYELRPMGSRFISLGSTHRFKLVSGRNAALALKTGVEVSWNNFMLEGNRQITADGPTVLFPETATPLSKSKLTAAYLNIPVMPTVVFRKGAFTHISLGGYAGMRLDSYTKVKEEDGTKDRTHGRYYLSNFRYGIGLDLGIRGVATLFAQYDLNTVFDRSRGPQLNTINFGIRL